MASRILYSRPAASASSSSATPPSFSAADAAASIFQRRRISAAAASFTTRRNIGVGGSYPRRKGVHLTSKFSGAPVPVVVQVLSRKSGRNASTTFVSPRSALVKKVTATELDNILSQERTSPMIIDFYATWCGPCVVLAQELEQLAVEYGEDIQFLKVDTDEEHELASQMEIRGLPTMVFVSKDVDKLAIRTEGLLPTDAIRDIIEKEILV